MKIREACKKLTTAAKRSANCPFSSLWGKVLLSRVFIYCLLNVATSISWNCMYRWMGSERVIVMEVLGCAELRGRVGGWLVRLSVPWVCVGVGGAHGDPAGCQGRAEDSS